MIGWTSSPVSGAATQSAGKSSRLDPSDWKPIATVGIGVREIRIRAEGGAFRVLYVANIGEVVYVLHAFQKKTQQTAKRNLDLAMSRLKQI